MYSDGRIKADKFEQIELDITKSQLEKIKSNQYNLFIRDNKLVLEEREYLVRKREREKEDKEFETLLTKIKDTNLITLLRKIRRR